VIAVVYGKWKDDIKKIPGDIEKADRENMREDWQLAVLSSERGEC
jgi:hypothetical protein